MRSDPDDGRRGAVYGFAAYLLWGGMPLYFRALAPAGALEILAQRILWSFVVCVALLAATGALVEMLRLMADRRTLAAVSLAGALISINWVTYLVAVTTGRITEAALGYFLNPLVSVALGLVVLHERLRPLQGVAVAIGAVAAVALAVDAGSVPVIPLLLAFSFGIYGLVKNRVGAGLEAVASLTAETAVLALPAAALAAFLHASGTATFADLGVGHAALLASAGVVTAVPLLLFAAAARRVTLVTVGMLQFIAPVLQFLSALLLGERLSTGRWIGFGIVWLALAVLVLDLVRSGRRRAREVAAQAELG